MGLSFRKASYEPGVVDFGTGAFAYLQPDGGWGFSNAGLVTDGGEALLVDTMFDTAHTRAMLDGFAKASAARIGTLVNTHHNGDHCYGNGCLDCEIIATVGAAEAMKHETPKGLAQFMKAAPGLGLTGEYLVHCFGDFDFENCSVRAPDTTFTGQASRMVGTKRVDLIEVGPAHTGGDALVHVPADKTLFTGDILFIDGHPILWAGPVLGGNRLIVLSSKGEAISVSPYTGELLGRQEMSAGGYLGPVVANNALYLLTDDANLSAYR